jgi:AraC-like DNA-binding protein/mannose-6-phosphate isomerase-like protein (cupin superfamily)
MKEGGGMLHRIVVQKAPIPEHRLFYCRELNDKHFDISWHLHEEYQLFLVLQGKGTRFVGNTVKSFEAGDLTFLGPNLPHLWKSEAGEPSHGIVVYLSPGIFEALAGHEELGLLGALFDKVRLGMEVYGKTREILVKQMQALVGKHGIMGFMQLLEILDTLSRSKEYHLMQEVERNYKAKELDSSRINAVYTYAAAHFRENITLEEMAALVNMAPTSFSRFFKNKTSKSFTYFLNEVRIKNACGQLIQEEAKTILNICFDSGFSTLSNFNRQFKLYTGMSPKEYRKRYMLV